MSEKVVIYLGSTIQIHVVLIVFMMLVIRFHILHVLKIKVKRNNLEVLIFFLNLIHRRSYVLESRETY